jgi:hypothetical protein
MVGKYYNKNCEKRITSVTPIKETRFDAGYLSVQMCKVVVRKLMMMM